MAKKKKAGDRNDPFVSFNFRVEIDGIEVFGFQQVDSISNESEIFEYQEGGVNNFIHKLVGQGKQSNITLKYGITTDKSMYEWRKLVLNHNIDKAKKNGTIKLVENGKVLKKWVFYNAWPSKWEAPNLNSMEDSVAVGLLELAVERIEEK